MSFFDRGPRVDGQSDPSTQRSLRRLQEDPARLAALLAGANGVVPHRRRRVGFFTMSGVTIVLLLSAIEAPSLFAAVGLTAQHTVVTGEPEHPPKGAATHGTQSWAPYPLTSKSISTSPSGQPSTGQAPPPTLAKTHPQTTPFARRSATMTASPTPTPTPTATATAHGKSKGHGKPRSGKN